MLIHRFHSRLGLLPVKKAKAEKYMHPPRANVKP
jgi:hypothetical protein